MADHKFPYDSPFRQSFLHVFSYGSSIGVLKNCTVLFFEDIFTSIVTDKTGVGFIGSVDDKYLILIFVTKLVLEVSAKELAHKKHHQLVFNVTIDAQHADEEVPDDYDL